MASAPGSGAGEVQVGVVTTVRNEADSIVRFLDALLSQSELPDRIVLVDGGSDDGTLERIERAAEASPVPISVINSPGANIATGRNIAIRNCATPIVAVTDAGTIPHRDWLAEIVKPLRDDGTLAVSAGFFLPGGSTPFERVLATLSTPQLEEVREDSFLPSSRSIAFRRDWWEKVGGYPEALDHSEDVVFDLALKREGAKFAFAPGALVEWTPRRSLRQFARQYFFYGRGDAHAGLWTSRYVLRVLIYLAGVALLASVRRTTWRRALLLTGGKVYLGRPYARLRRVPPGKTLRDRTLGWILVPIVTLTSDLSKLAGFAWGKLERLRGS
jgi:glycosyltransferase involved in cell wall biosynthesis